MTEKLYTEELRELMDFIKENNLSVGKDVKRIENKIDQLNGSVVKKELCDAYRETLGNQIKGVKTTIIGAVSLATALLTYLMFTL